jgi:hypothetical protein
VALGIEFDWDAENTKHLAAHQVTAREFESVLLNAPLDLEYEVVDGEPASATYKRLFRARKP